MAGDETGFIISGEFYPAVESFTLGDPVLIMEITGMAFPDFAEAVGAQADDGRADPSLTAGMIAVSVWRKHPGWPRKRVQQFVQQLALTDIEFVAPQQEEEAEANSPPEVVSGSGEKSPSSDATSDGSPAPTAEPSSPPDAGHLGLVTGSLDSHQAV